MDNRSVEPARPPDGGEADAPRREIRSYARRGSRLTPSRAAAWAAHHEDWVIPVAAITDPGFAVSDCFGRTAPLVVEIGSGVGEATLALAAARPAYDVLALEVWRPGVAETLGRLADAGVTNVRLCEADAAWVLEHRIPEDSLAGLWTFFPDPWPKKRHHKRRLVSPGFAAVAARRLAPGSPWRLATDWADYAEHIRQVLDAQPLLEGGVVERWPARPVTRFERKGLAAGRQVTDLCYTRRRVTGRRW